MPMIRELREQHGWTQRELGERVGVSGHAVWCWESGTKIPSVPTLRKLAGVFSLPMDVIWFPKECASPETSQ